MTPHPAQPRQAGFTLLELVMAMLLLTILIGMVFGIARTSLALGNTVVKSQNEEMLHQAFFELLGQRFSALPGNTRFDLKVQDSNKQYLSDLTLQNVPLSFTWGGQPRIAKAVQLSTIRRRSGFLSIVLRYYENEILEGSDALNTPTITTDNQPFAEIELLDDVAYFEWRVLDGRSLEWQYDWEIQGRLPLQLELTLAFGANGEEMRHIFWIPPKLNPEVVLRQMMQPATTQPATTPTITIPAPATP
jgi:prepilin-type N-terminal cleavage/methylation domain-containing protein